MKLTIKLSALSKLKEDGRQKKFYVRSAAIILINRPLLNPRKFKLFSVGSICSVKKVLGLELLVRFGSKQNEQRIRFLIRFALM